MSRPQDDPDDYQPLVETLTKREQEIAALVALALTDRQIAGILFTSVRTVKFHIENIRSKLCLANRTAICRRVLIAKYEQNTDLFHSVIITPIKFN